MRDLINRWRRWRTSRAKLRAGWMDPCCDFCQGADAVLHVILVHPGRATVACPACKDEVLATPYARLVGVLR